MNDLAGNQIFRGEWSETIPPDWKQRRIKHLFSIKKKIAGELGHDVISITQRGAKLKDTESGEGQLSMDYSKYQLVKRGDFLMNHMDLLTGYVDISMFDGVTSPDYRVFVSSSADVHPSYFLYVFQHCYKSKIFYGYGRGSSHLGRWRFPTVEFEDFYLPVPLSDEQVLISLFLDKKTEKIDRLIEKIQKKIKLLKEQRTSLINQCVTKGLDPNAEMKDSGVDWIGEIPEHWIKIPIKHLFNYKKGANAQQLTKEYIHEHEGPYKVFSGSTDPSGVGSIDDYEFDYEAVIHVSTVGSEKIMSTQLIHGKFSLSQNCMILVPKKKLCLQVIHWIIQLEFNERRKQLPKILQLSFRFEDLDQISIFVPPIDEQEEIFEKIQSQIVNFIKIEKKEQIRVDLLKEYRQSLISSAVTGKIRITEDMI